MTDSSFVDFVAQSVEGRSAKSCLQLSPSPQATRHNFSQRRMTPTIHFVEQSTTGSVRLYDQGACVRCSAGVAPLYCARFQPRFRTAAPTMTCRLATACIISCGAPRRICCCQMLHRTPHRRRNDSAKFSEKRFACCDRRFQLNSLQPLSQNFSITIFSPKSAVTICSTQAG